MKNKNAEHFLCIQPEVQNKFMYDHNISSSMIPILKNGHSVQVWSKCSSIIIKLKYDHNAQHLSKPSKTNLKFKHASSLCLYT